MKLAKYKWRINRQSGYVQANLVSLGMPRSRVYAKPGRHVKTKPKHGIHDSFWDKNYYELMDILKDARQLYLLKMKKHHPDSGNGCAKAASTLTVIWARIKRLFKRRGIEL